MAKSYGVRPSKVLFPYRSNPNFLLAVDNAVNEIGMQWEMEVEMKKEKLRMEHLNNLARALIGR